MASFLTPAEMFKEFQDEVFEQERQYENLMIDYARYAAEKIGVYAECVAEAYLDGLKTAHKVFDKLGLSRVHAYAIEEQLACFIMEYDETEVNERDYE